MHHKSSIKKELFVYFMTIMCCVSGLADVTEDMICPGNLVLAEVKSVNVQGNSISGSLKIMHVYKGSDKAKGLSFDMSGTTGESFYHQLTFSTVPKIGELGVWLLDLKLNVDIGRHENILLFQLPARKGDASGRYDDVVKWAEAVEILVKTGQSNRLKLLKTFATSQPFEVSSWALHIIASSDPTGSVAFFDQLLTNDKMSTCALIAFDDVQPIARGKAWKTSKERVTLLQKLVSATMSKTDSIRLVTKLSVIQQYSDLEDGLLLTLLKTAVDNQQLSAEARQNALYTIGRVCERGKDEGEAFKMLIMEIKDATEKQIKLAAAYSIQNFVPLDKSRIAVVQMLKQTIQDQELADVLQKILEPQKSSLIND